MTDLATAETPDVSTTLHEDGTGPSGAGAPRTLRDTIADAMKEEPAPEVKEEAPAEADDADKGDEKSKAEPEKGKEEEPDSKSARERGPDGKFAGKPEADATDDVEKPQPKPEPAKPERAGHIEPPKSFMPDAKETWRNTPRAVQRDVESMARTHEAELTRYREASERYEPLRQFDDIVRANGRAGLQETLAEVAQLEDLMEKNPIAALNQVLMRAGPRKADGQPVSLFELAQHIVQTGQDNYLQTVQRMPQQQPQEDPRVAQLEQQLAQVQEQQITSSVIEPFRAANPRYDELQEDIAFFLKSGRIPDSLSLHDRLALAYDMAVRVNPASHDTAPPSDRGLDDADRVVPDSSGSKSIKSAPGAISADLEPERGGSIRDLLQSELKRQRR